MNAVGGDPVLVAEAVLDAVSHPRPLPRYYVGEVMGWPMFPLCAFLSHAPEWITDRVL